MKFLKEEKKVSVNSISKSFAENYETCKLKAWKKKRKNRDNENRFLLVGKTAHAIFASKVAERVGEKYEVPTVKDPSIVYEANLVTERVDLDKLIGKEEILGYESMVESKLSNGISLIGVFDLVTLAEDEFLGTYIHVLDYKSGFKVSKEVDNEVLFYAYLAADKFKMPVLFTRYSGRSGDMWGKFFTYEEAIALEPLISVYAEEIKGVVESEEEPFPEAGPHCLACPFLDECSAKDLDETNPQQLITKYQLLKARTKMLESQLKNMRFENENPIETPEFVIDIKESRSKQLKKGKKEDILLLLLKSGNLERHLSALDIKLTPEVVKTAEEAGFEFKEQVRRSLNISTTTEKKGEANE